jgi:hypothetical protein
MSQTTCTDDLTYPGKPWHADESEDCVRIFRGNLQIIKAPKQHTPYEEYWPDPEMIKWIVCALNQAENSTADAAGVIKEIQQ